MLSTKTTRNIQRLIWLYFWLLIFEGALRKWVLPQFSTPLLVIRDPVVIGAYFLALRAELFPKNIFNKIIISLAYICFFVSLVTIITYNDSNPAVALFGLRTNFLHLPLIFLTPKLFSLEDVKKLGKWVLLLALPMSILMVYQFIALPDAFINRTTGIDEGQQITSALGKVRTPGTFSFVTGTAQYLSLVASFLLYGLFQRKVYPYWLLFAGGIGLVLALAVSGSRLAVGLVGVVLISLMAVLVVRLSLIKKYYKILALVGAVGFGISFVPSFNEGIKVLGARAELANTVEATGGGITGRFFQAFIEPFNNTYQIPLFGHGLGMGTNAGAALLTGKRQFLLAEGEWARVILESGLVLGLLYILLRIAILGWMGRLCIKSASLGNILPMLLFGACVLNILMGQFGQPTSLGFAVLVGGLCLAACRTDERGLQPK